MDEPDRGCHSDPLTSGGRATHEPEAKVSRLGGVQVGLLFGGIVWAVAFVIGVLVHMSAKDSAAAATFLGIIVLIGGSLMAS
jgi:hypothetical protein